MSDPIDLTITNAGLDALVDAQNGITDAIEVVQVGLTEAVFVPAPTLTALPGETKRLGSVAGASVAANVIHMAAQDASAETYDLRGIGLYLADGTLFATYGQADPIFRKVSIATFLLAFDVRFSQDVAGNITFGDASFLYPPATETVQGVAELATQAETDAGEDDERIVTPLKLAGALGARSVTGAGLATGGGDLSADREITVTEASDAEVAAGTDGSHVLTPRRARTLLPAGAVFAFAMTAAPPGYLECDGAAVLRGDYADLFDAIGTTFGAGDGATTFNLPDLRGEFIRGWDDGRGIDAGRQFGSAQADEFKSHFHTLTDNGEPGGDVQGKFDVADSNSGSGMTASTNATGGTETRPRNVALLYAIKT